ncbi:MAG: N-6 DNA methylase [Verrucomicrobiota bacterium]|nr:N-6 DNA methylase [Verrucomicrobiota bacterium]
MAYYSLEQITDDLLGIGYTHQHIVTDVRLWDSGLSIPLLAYCRTPHDLRSAGIAVTNLPEGAIGSNTVSNLKACGAPAVIALGGRQNWEFWRQSYTDTPRLERSGDASQLSGFLQEYRSYLSPDAIYRTKLWGRTEPKERQLELLDLSFLPAAEFALGKRVAELLEECFETLMGELGWSYKRNHLSPRDAKWLIQAPFWLLAAKILRDKSVFGFKNIELKNFDDTFTKLAKHYQSRSSTPIPVTVAKSQEHALNQVATLISQFPSLELMSTEALGHVYESAIINKETRKRLGTHSSPVWLIDYMLGRLRPLIANMPVERRRVFEPAVGHAGFLVGALRVLDELLPASLHPQRKEYLRKRLAGVDIDDFSQEVARLALTLADVPNANGWSLECLDMYKEDILASRISKADIILANPPFENFSATARPDNSLVNKAAEVVRQTLLHLPPGGIFGFVLPQTFLSSNEGIETRKSLFNQCEVLEITLFADKVFEFGAPESCIILGHKPQLKSPTPHSVIYKRVREHQVATFSQDYIPSSAESVNQQYFLKNPNAEGLVPELRELWEYLSQLLKLSQIANVGKGFEHRAETDPKFPLGAERISEKYIPGWKQGFSKWNPGQMTHLLPKDCWLNLDKSVIRCPLWGTAIGIPQVLLNYARISRSEWRLKALIDELGHPVTSRFLVVRPLQSTCSLTALWGLLNSPLANLYAFSVSSKRDILTGDMREFPIPENFSTPNTQRLEHAVTAYLNAARDFDKLQQTRVTTEEEDTLFHSTVSPNQPSLAELQQQLMYLHWRVDAEVLKLYKLPPHLEQQLLQAFTGVKRQGVPFTQTEYFPKHFTDLQTLEELLSITGDWEQTSTHKTALIEKKIDGTATDADLQELSRLKYLTEARGEYFAPLPLAQLQALKHKMQVTGQWVES